MRRPILNNSSPGQAVYEPFLGSGTTLIAAETVGRACFAIEIDPLFVDVAVRRWQAFAGKESTLLKTGEGFGAVESERGQLEAGSTLKTEEADVEGRPSRGRRCKSKGSPSPGGPDA